MTEKNFSFPFAANLKQLNIDRDTTIKAVAEHVGITRQAVSQYCDGATQPNAETVAKIARYFNVSSDWLLGLSDVQSTDQATKELCQTLGLSEEAIAFLRELEFEEKLYFTNIRDAISEFLSSERAYYFFSRFVYAKQCAMKAVALRKRLNDDEGGGALSDLLDTEDSFDLEVFRMTNEVQQIMSEMRKRIENENP